MEPLRQVAPDGYEYFSSKTYDHDAGFSCCFRQWKAEHSHCRFLHGYAFKVKMLFSATTLDQRGWVMDFGALKSIKEHLRQIFDHKTVVAEDDPELGTMQALEQRGLIQLVVLPHVGCEAFAEIIFGLVKDHVQSYNKQHDLDVWLRGVEVSEHGGNSASYMVKP